MFLALLQANSTPVVGDLTGVGVGTLVFLALVDKVLPLIRRNGKDGSSPQPKWAAEQTDLLRDMRDDIKELVTIQRIRNGASNRD